MAVGTDEARELLLHQRVALARLRLQPRAVYDRHVAARVAVVMPEKYGRELEDTEVNVEGDDWVFYLGEEPDRLRGLLARLTA